jgi:ATP-dependent DNA ligase
MPAARRSAQRVSSRGVDGAVVFRQACVMGLERIVAKRRDSRYHSGRSRDWIKIKNMAHPAIERAMLIALSKTVAARRK